MGLLMLTGYLLGVVIGYEIVKFLRVVWFLHKLGKVVNEVEEKFNKSNDYKEE